MLGNPSFLVILSESEGPMHFAAQPECIGLSRQRTPLRMTIRDDASVVENTYMIAVGGAGSSGLPALASGTRTITRTSTTNAASEAQIDGVQ